MSRFDIESDVNQEGHKSLDRELLQSFKDNYLDDEVRDDHIIQPDILDDDSIGTLDSCVLSTA